MAKPNYSFEKRKKEMERVKKKDEKKQRKHERVEEGTESSGDADVPESVVEEF